MQEKLEKVISVLTKLHVWNSYLFEEFHVTKHPLIPDAGDPEVPLEQGMKAIQEKLHRCEEVVRGCSQGTSSKETEGKAKGDKKGILFVVDVFVVRSEMDKYWWNPKSTWNGQILVIRKIL